MNASQFQKVDLQKQNLQKTTIVKTKKQFPLTIEKTNQKKVIQNHYSPMRRGYNMPIRLNVASKTQQNMLPKSAKQE